ncbi:MAG: CoB--CoM heterodisulfide reductase subunit C [Promethearchaeota archaeon]
MNEIITKSTEEFSGSNRKYRILEDFTPEFFADIERRTNILSCIQCGTCTASCESGRWTALKTRLIIRRLILGDLSVLEDPDIWLCTTCYSCYERCPRDVRPTDVIIELRNYASKIGNMSPNHISVIGYLRSTGHAVPINDKIIKQREALGLEPIPPTFYKYRVENDLDIKAFRKLFRVVEKGKEYKEKKAKAKENLKNFDKSNE